VDKYVCIVYKRQPIGLKYCKTNFNSSVNTLINKSIL
jgi:hypothetical protein